MIRREKPIVSSLSNLITSFFTLGIGIVTGIIVTRALGPDLKGEFTNIKLIATLYAPFLLMGYQGGVLYYGLKKKIELKQFFWGGWFLTAIISLVVIVIFFPLVINGYLGEVVSSSEESNIILGLSVIPFILLNSYSTNVIISNHLFRASNIRVVAGGLVTLIYYLILFLFYKITLYHAIFGFLLGQAIQLLLSLYFIIRYIGIKWVINLKQVFKPFNYGIKTWFNKLIYNSNDKFDLIILSFLLNNASLGLYSAGVGLSNLVTTIPSSYISVFFNQIAEKPQNDGLLLYAKAQRVTFIITLSLAILLSVFALPLIYIMYGKAFVTASWVVILYSPGLIFQVAARLSIKFYAGQGRPLKNSMFYIVGLLVSLPFYFLLIPKLGIRGAAIASSIAYFTAFTFSFFQIHRDYGLSFTEIVKFKREDFKYIYSLIVKLPGANKFLK